MSLGEFIAWRCPELPVFPSVVPLQPQRHCLIALCVLTLVHATCCAAAPPYAPHRLPWSRSAQRRPQ